MTEESIFQELDQVIACQNQLEVPASVVPMETGPGRAASGAGTQFIITNIPLVDIIINIDIFNGHFEDRQKILRIVKEIYNHCTSMKKLLLKHGKLILSVLIAKYD